MFSNKNKLITKGLKKTWNGVFHQVFKNKYQFRNIFRKIYLVLLDFQFKNKRKNKQFIIEKTRRPHELEILRSYSVPYGLSVSVLKCSLSYFIFQKRCNNKIARHSAKLLDYNLWRFTLSVDLTLRHLSGLMRLQGIGGPYLRDFQLNPFIPIGRPQPTGSIR